MALSPMRLIPRSFSTSATGYSKSLTSIPGLCIYPDFLQSDVRREVLNGVFDINNKILQSATKVDAQRCKTFLSQYHNSKCAEYYRLVEVNDTTGRKIRGQHFEKYGDDGHKLTYFIGNNNIPEFVNRTLIPRILELSAVSRIITKNGAPECNLTLNSYAATKKHPGLLPGFDFHKDIGSNGQVTLIYSIGFPSEFQIRHPEMIENTSTFPLRDNTLVLLSNEARWDYEHRVIPVEVTGNDTLSANGGESVKRMSLVLGFK